MSKKQTKTDSIGKNGWVQRFIDLQLKELNGEKLSKKESHFLAALEFADRMIPGALVEEIIAHGLGSRERPFVLKPTMVSGRVTPYPPGSTVHPPVVAAAGGGSGFDRIAAETKHSLYDQVQKAIKDRHSSVYLELGVEKVEIFQIESRQDVKPCYRDDFTFSIERAGSKAQVVDPYGAIKIAIDDLKNMELYFDAEDKKIRLIETKNGSDA